MNIEEEIQKNQNEIKRIKKLIPYAILLGIGFSFVTPLAFFYLYNKFKSIYYFLGYPWLVFITAVLYAICYILSLNIGISKFELNIKRLRARRTSRNIEKQNP